MFRFSLSLVVKAVTDNYLDNERSFVLFVFLFFSTPFIRIVNKLISVVKLSFPRTVATIWSKKSILKNTYPTVATL